MPPDTEAHDRGRRRNHSEGYAYEKGDEEVRPQDSASSGDKGGGRTLRDRRRARPAKRRGVRLVGQAEVLFLPQVRSPDGTVFDGGGERFRRQHNLSFQAHPGDAVQGVPPSGVGKPEDKGRQRTPRRRTDKEQGERLFLRRHSEADASRRWQGQQGRQERLQQEDPRPGYDNGVGPWRNDSDDKPSQQFVRNGIDDQTADPPGGKRHGAFIRDGFEGHVAVELLLGGAGQADLRGVAELAPRAFPQPLAQVVFRGDVRGRVRVGRSRVAFPRMELDRPPQGGPGQRDRP